MRAGLALAFLILVASAAGGGLAHADCAMLYGLAQQHANDMARRDHLDHAGFMQRHRAGGATAENVAVGCADEGCARAMWMKSPRHRANMGRGGCQAIASAVSRSGRHYWVMEIGGGGGVAAPRDFSIEGANAP